MGVKGLWQLLEPVGRPVTLESLEGKVLSVDASILLNQAIKGMRDKSGNPLPNAHLVVLFNRLCKLLFYRIKPIFIFDGGVPILKKKTLAIRKERKFKAKHGSNKATEKLVKNYLKGKALETVTGRKSMKTVFRNNSPREPDIFELPPVTQNQETTQEPSSSEAEDDDGLQPFYSQHDFEKKFQDPSSINVDSQDFRSLPEEIQHELIKDVMEERKWTTIQSMPQDAFDFSDYQLQNVLQRGKLHQRLDELRKEMNNRNNGEVSGLSSQQDGLGADSSVLSQRIISEDSGHYVLIKTSKNDVKDQDTAMIDSLNEGGFFREDQQAPPQQTKPTSHSRVPSFEVDMTCQAESSDSDINVSLLDVPEVVVLDLDEPHKKGGDTKEEREEDNDLTMDGDRETMANNSLQDECVDIPNKNNEETIQAEEDEFDVNSEDNISVKSDGEERIKTVGSEVTLDDLSLDKDETEETDSIEAQIEQRRNQIEKLLSKRQSTTSSQLSYHEEIGEKTVQDEESSHDNTHFAGEECDNLAVVTNGGTSALPNNDGMIEFRLQLESNSDEEGEENILSNDHEVKSDKDTCKDEEENLRENFDNLEVATNDGASVVPRNDGMSDFRLRLESNGDEDEEDEDKFLSNDREVICDKDKDEEENLTVKEDLEKDSSDITDQKEETEMSNRANEKLIENVREEEKEEGMEIEEANHEGEPFVPDDTATEAEVVPASSEFAGTSKEDLEVMQMNLEIEQQSLQTERARQERMAATVSNEMLTESQELLRLFGVPYIVSPMEAEAQCAFLDLTQQTSGTITDDSDVFLFGGTRVYKNIFNQNKHAELYTIDAITGHLALDRSKMINIAFITGSDYTEGIQGLGAVGAMEVLHEFSSEGFEALIKFKKWHDETKKNKNSIQETNVKKKLRTLTLPSGFPSQEVFDSYKNPVIDESHEAFEWGKPDLHGLRLFAQEKLGWPAAKTDEILLPVLKQLNKQENQMRMEDFYQIKFHEPRKKPSRRVRRVINRFLNPLSSSESSSEDEGRTSSGSQSSVVKGRGKEAVSRNKMAAARISRGRGRGQSRGRRSKGKDLNIKRFKDGGLSGQDINDRSIASNDHVEGEEERDSALVDRNPKKEGRKIGKRKMVGKGKMNLDDQERCERSLTDKGNCNIRNVKEDNEMLKTQGAHNDKNNKPNNLSSNLENNENNDSMLQRNNVKNQRYKIPKKSSTAKNDESGSSGLGNKHDDSSTSSDSDSEEGRTLTDWAGSGNLPRMNKNGGRGVGRKRTRGRGRGRRGAIKRSKIEKIS